LPARSVNWPKRSTLAVAGEPSDVEKLIGAAIMEELLERSVPVDGVSTGVFDEKSDFVAGPKTVTTFGNILPHEITL